MKNNSMKIFIAILLSFTLFSCSHMNNMKNESKTENANAITSEANIKDEISPIASEAWFRDDIHMILNPTNRIYSLVRGDGTVVLKTLDPEIENIGKIDDVDKNVTNYLYKSFNGENYSLVNISNIDDEPIEDALPSQRCVVYDRDGNEVVNLENTNAPNYSSKNKIIYALRQNYDTGKLHALDVKTKEIKEYDYDIVSVMNGKFIFSTDPWDSNMTSEIVILDEDLNEVKKIEGYSLDSVTKTDGVEYASIRKKLKVDGEYQNKINFIDKDFNIILENDVDERIWEDNSVVLTLRTGNKVIDYDFSKNQFVGEEREYKSKEDNIEQKELEKEYEKMINKIESENTKDGESKYSYVSEFAYDGKVLYLGHIDGNRGMFDHDPIDVYNDEGIKIAEFDDLSNQFNSLGYLFVNHDTVYNIDMQVVGTLKEKRNTERSEKFGKTFFYDRTGLDYDSVKPFTLYNEKFEPVFENLECIQMDTYDDYIVIVDNDGTKLIDKDFNVVKSINRKIDIKSWYGNKTIYRQFEDLETERMGIIDKDFNIVVDKLKYIGDMEEKFFVYQNGFYYGFMDYEGRLILKLSIFDTMREDAIEPDFDGDYVIKYDDYD